MLDQAKMIMKMKKLQKQLAKEIIEVEAGDGAVTVKITGEQKIKSIEIDPSSVDLDDIGQLEKWLEMAVKDAITQSQKVAAEKMRPVMGGLGNLGLWSIYPNMQVLPSALENLIEELGKLPGVGPRTAQRYAFFLLKRSPDQASLLAIALNDVHAKIAHCPKTFALIEKDETVSPLYSAKERDKKTIAVVEDPLDIVALEKTGHYKGTYHVLGGVLSPIDNIGPEELHINELVQRINDDDVQEIIIATNTSIEGESTALYIQKLLSDKTIKITRLARGLPAGADIEYADQITLSRALQERQLF